MQVASRSHVSIPIRPTCVGGPFFTGTTTSTLQDGFGPQSSWRGRSLSPQPPSARRQVLPAQGYESPRPVQTPSVVGRGSFFAAPFSNVSPVHRAQSSTAFMPLGDGFSPLGARPNVATSAITVPRIRSFSPARARQQVRVGVSPTVVAGARGSCCGGSSVQATTAAPVTRARTPGPDRLSVTYRQELPHSVVRLVSATTTTPGVATPPCVNSLAGTGSTPSVSGVGVTPVTSTFAAPVHGNAHVVTTSAVTQPIPATTGVRTTVASATMATVSTNAAVASSMPAPPSGSVCSATTVMGVVEDDNQETQRLSTLSSGCADTCEETQHSLDAYTNGACRSAQSSVANLDCLEAQLGENDSTPIDKLEPGVEITVGEHRLQVIDMLGSGSYSVVWRAKVVSSEARDGRRPPCDTEVALKDVVCKSHPAFRQSLLEVQLLLALERRLLRSDTPRRRRPLRLPRCYAYRVDTQPGAWCVRTAMTRLPGEQLDEWLRRSATVASTRNDPSHANGEWPPWPSHLVSGVVMAERLLLQMGPTLEGIAPLAWHRDVNSHNVLVSDAVEGCFLNPTDSGQRSDFSLCDLGLAVESRSWTAPDGAWRVTDIGGDCRYWPASSWMVHLYGADYLTEREDFCRQYQTRLDVHGLGITAVEILCSVSLAARNAGAEAGPSSWSGPSATGSRHMDSHEHWERLLDVWQTYHTTVGGWWEMIYSVFSVGGDFRPVHSWLVQEEVADQVVALLQDIRQALRACAEHADAATARVLNILADLTDEVSTLELSEACALLEGDEAQSCHAGPSAVLSALSDPLVSEVVPASRDASREPASAFDCGVDGSVGGCDGIVDRVHAPATVPTVTSVSSGAAWRREAAGSRSPRVSKGPAPTPTPVGTSVPPIALGSATPVVGGMGGVGSVVNAAPVVNLAGYVGCGGACEGRYGGGNAISARTENERRGCQERIAPATPVSCVELPRRVLGSLAPIPALSRIPRSTYNTTADTDHGVHGWHKREEEVAELKKAQDQLRRDLDQLQQVKLRLQYARQIHEEARQSPTRVVAAQPQHVLVGPGRRRQSRGR
eukprot:TRINITY_DN54536_c0_g1_i1.p1 TRINITY_DN54536_c0_g1~~TRINITY_DN54536_c0_g1_i1.p1  ORF type:complete len:1066 (+),score=139.92 TRINITY_DN54536_c0_g1_i1:136-3333(+)